MLEMFLDLLIAPLQSRTTLIIFVVVLIVSVFVGVAGGAPQCGLIALFLIIQFVPVFQRREPRLDLVELRGADDVLVAGRKNGSNLLLRLLDAVRSLWVRGECFGQSSRLLFLLGLKLFEESHKGVRIVSGFVHVLQTEIV